MTTMLTAFVRDERGATAIEYGLIAVLISVAIIAALTNYSGAVSRLWGVVSNRVDSVIP
jgi:pilus assembly protein Flp/PilA